MKSLNNSAFVSLDLLVAVVLVLAVLMLALQIIPALNPPVPEANMKQVTAATRTSDMLIGDKGWRVSYNDSYWEKSWANKDYSDVKRIGFAFSQNPQNILDEEKVDALMYPPHNDTPSTWWNKSWLYRQKIAITNNNASLALYDNYSVGITLNTASLIREGKMLPNGDDLRITYWNGSNETELDRINETEFNTASTEIWFRTQKPIPKGATVDNYSIYYGNRNLGQPPANKSKIYLLWEPFNNANNWTNWTNKGALPNISGNGNTINISNSWWNSSWAKKIDNQIPNGTRPYQLSLNISNATGNNNATHIYCNGNCNVNFTDIRFTLNDATVLPYWIEDNTTGKVWVNVTGNGTVNLYYGNPSASSASNFDTTFTKEYNKSGLVAEWHMDEGSGSPTISDSSGNGNTGTLTNMNITGNATSGWQSTDGGQWDNRSDVKFSSGSSLRFDGVNDYVDAGNGTSLNIGGAITLEAWVKFGSITNYPAIVGKGRTWGIPSTPVYTLAFAGSTNRAHFCIGNGILGPYLYSNKNNFVVGSWYHIVGLWDGTTNTNGMKMYIDGILDVQGTSTISSIQSTADNVIIGRDLTRPESIYFFNGTVDEVRIYNRSLSAAEIKANYERRKYADPEPSYTMGVEQTNEDAGLYHSSFPLNSSEGFLIKQRSRSLDGMGHAFAYWLADINTSGPRISSAYFARDGVLANLSRRDGTLITDLSNDTGSQVPGEWYTYEVLRMGDGGMRVLRNSSQLLPSSGWAYDTGLPSNRAIVKSVQRGTLTSLANGPVNATIAAVDMTKSFLIFQTRHNSNRPPGSMVRGRIATPTSVEFVRITDEISPITIQWYVVEFSSGVKVQRGEVIQSATTINVPINPVAAVNQAFVTWSKTPGATDQIWSSDDPLVAELTNATNLQFRVNSENSDHIIWWQVIEFTNPADINVQKGSTSLLWPDLSTNITLNTPVDVNKTFLLVGFHTDGDGTDVGSRMLRAQLFNSTTITIDRSIPGDWDDITEIAWQAVELKNGAKVQRGSENFPTGVAQRIVSLSTSVDINRSIAFASVQPAGGQNMGRSSYNGDDIIGVGSVTMALNATHITMTRNNTLAVADIGWFVVEFPSSVPPLAGERLALGRWGNGTSEYDWLLVRKFLDPEPSAFLDLEDQLLSQAASWWEYPISSSSKEEKENASRALGLKGYNFYMQLRPLNESLFNEVRANYNITRNVPDARAAVVERYVFIRGSEALVNASGKTAGYRLVLWVW